jgi:hypothetical protein
MGHNSERIRGGERGREMLVMGVGRLRMRTDSVIDTHFCWVVDLLSVSRK